MTFAELTIDELHTALRDRRITSMELVDWYLARIDAQDKAGAAIQAIVTVNPRARDEAAERDRYLSEHGDLAGPLHGVPVLVKDQAETAGLRTTFGSKLFEDYVPEADATVIERLRAAGAIILAKTAMCDLAAGWFSSSSLTDHTKNPYQPDREAGGSSAGTGAGLAADFGLAGIGEDTGGSIRIPASFNNVFGLRVTTGLVSRAGFSPLVHFQDTPGPMGRTVADLARVLDAIVGYDPADPFTAVAWPSAGGYANALDEATPLGAFRCGVLETGFGSGPDAEPVSTVIRDAVARLTEWGTDIVAGLEIENLPDWIADTSVYVKQSKSDISRFLAARPAAPVHDFASVYDSGVFHPFNDLFHGIATGPDDIERDSESQRLRLNQERFRRLVLNIFAANRLDFLVYPTVQVIPPTRAELLAKKYSALTFPTNTVIGSQAGLPAMSIPAGFTRDGLPVGMELLGTPHAERRMLQFAQAWEKAARPRKAPTL
ncbi:amidase [Nocardia sp. NPDC049190]|uniref:amidase n=1 Tax=Nocardia sp. NPDC049190 TaxID=3155650 RepID=UPI0033F67FF9